MTTTATLTKTEALAIAHAARYVVGVSWDYLEADTLKGKLTEAIADDHDHRLEVLLALVDGVRYDLCGLDQQAIREATVTETLTTAEIEDIVYAARRVVGSEQWDSHTGLDLRTRLRLALAAVAIDCDDDSDPDVKRMMVLLHLARGTRYFLRRPRCMDVNRTVVREATVAETIEAMFATSHLYADDICGPCEVAMPC